MDIAAGNNVLGAAKGWIYSKKSTNGAAYIENGRMYFSGSKYDVIYRDGGEVWGNYTLEADFCYTDDNLYVSNSNYGWGGMLYNVQSDKKFQKVGITVTGNASVNGYEGSKWTNNSTSLNKYEMSKNPELVIPKNNQPFRMKVVVYNKTATLYYAMLNNDGSMQTDFILLKSISNIPANAQTGSIGFMTSTGKLGAFWVDNIKCYSDTLVSFSEDFTYDDTSLIYDDASTTADESINAGLGMQYVRNCANGVAKIEDGALRMSGSGTGINAYDGVFFTMGNNWTNYALEADFTYNMKETGWSGLFYRSTNLKNFQKAALTPFATTYAKGTAVLNGKLNGSWYKDGKGTSKFEYDASGITVGTTFRLRVEAVENSAKLFVAYYDSNGKLGEWNLAATIENNFAEQHMTGTIGLIIGGGKNTLASDVTIDNVTVSRIPGTDRVAEPVLTADIYEPVSGIVNPPVAIQTLTDTLPAESGKRPAVVLAELDGSLNILGEGGKVLATADEFVDTYRTVLIPAFIIDSEAEATALAQFIAEKELSDCYIVADAKNAGLVRAARLANSFTKLATGALIFDDLNSAAARQNARVAVTENMSYVAISRAPLSFEAATYFATRQIAAWSYADSEAEVYRGIANGYHGIISEDASEIYGVYESITAPTVSGKPIVILHRGANASAAEPYPENTIMGIRAAKEVYGADGVEIDAKLTKDGYVVLMHDATIDRTMDGTGNVADYTLAELKAMTVDQIAGKETEIATFEELMILIKDMDMVVYCHASPNDKLMASLSYLISKYGCEDKVIIFTGKTQYTAQNNGVGSNPTYGFENQPLVAEGLVFVRGDMTIFSGLGSDLAGINALREAIGAINYQPFFYPYSKQGATWNTESFYYQLSARGFVNSHSVTNGQANMDKLVLTNAGAVGLLTDNPHLCDDYHYALDVKNITLKAGEKLSLTQTMKLTVGTVQVNCGIIQLDGAPLVEVDGGYTLNEAGTATVVFYADRTADGGSVYRIYSEPVTVTVEAANEGEVSRKIFWAFEDGVLSITGRGKIKNFSANTAPWCHLADQVTKVVIGEGITYIGSSAFFNFAAIEAVELPSTLTAIGRYAFYGCTALKNVTIPEAVTEIGAYAFRRSGLETVDFAIGYGWSAGDKSFNITEITAGGHRFISKSYYKLDWVRNIEAEAEELPSNYVDGGIMHTDVLWTITTLENGKLKLTIFGNGAMADYGTACTPWYGYAADIVEIEVTEGVTTVGRCAFYGLKFVRTVTLPETLTAIGDYGFYMCYLMKEITIPEGVTSIGKDAFVKTGLSEIPTV